jgi:Xaa-Pro aminopeptidase
MTERIDRNIVAREKLEQARVLMAEQGVDLWLVYARNKSDPALELLFNCSSAGELLFLISPRGITAIAEKADAAALEKSGLYQKVLTASPGGFMPLFIEEFNRIKPNHIALNTSESDSRCDGLTLGLYQRLNAALEGKLSGLERCSQNMLETLRAVKTPSEIAIMEECCRITCDVYDATFKRIHTGLSETDVGAIMMEEIQKNGGDGTGIGDPTELPLIAITRCGLAHRKPSPKNIIQPGDVMVIDFSVRYNGYCSDIARTMYFLKPGEAHAPDEPRKVIEAAIRAVGAVYAMIGPGVKGYEVDEAGRGSIVASGYPEFAHSTGHQVGLECHDGGTVLGKNKAKAANCQALRVNEVYAIEPTVLQDPSKSSAIVEDNILITESGYRLLSRRQTAVIEIPYRA